MVTEKRSQIQSVSKRNPNELDQTSPFSINPRLKLKVQISNSDIESKKLKFKANREAISDSKRVEVES